MLSLIHSATITAKPSVVVLIQAPRISHQQRKSTLHLDLHRHLHLRLDEQISLQAAALAENPWYTTVTTQPKVFRTRYSFELPGCDCPKRARPATLPSSRPSARSVCLQRGPTPCSVLSLSPLPSNPSLQRHTYISPSHLPSKLSLCSNILIPCYGQTQSSQVDLTSSHLENQSMRSTRGSSTTRIELFHEQNITFCRYSWSEWGSWIASSPLRWKSTLVILP